MSQVEYQYAVLRVVPRVERGEFVNAGVLVYSRAAGFLGARVHLDARRLHAIDRRADVDAIEAALASAADVCAGTGAGAEEDIGKRFRWLTAPRSTVVQPGPVHTGLTGDVRAEPERLLRLLVLPLPAG